MLHVPLQSVYISLFTPILDLKACATYFYMERHFPTWDVGFNIRCCPATILTTVWNTSYPSLMQNGLAA